MEPKELYIEEWDNDDDKHIMKRFMGSLTTLQQTKKTTPDHNYTEVIQSQPQLQTALRKSA